MKPYLIPKQEKPLDDGENLQTPLQLMAFKQYTQCINCLLCYAACPQCGLERRLRRSGGARAGAPLQPRFAATAARTSAPTWWPATTGIWECTFVGACSEVCPKHVDPAAAIQQTKISASLDWFKARLMPGAHR